MATNGSDSGGQYSITSDDAAVLAYLRGITTTIPSRVDVPFTEPMNPARDKATATTFLCDRETYRAAIRLAGYAPTVETGDIGSGRGTRVTFEHGRFFCSTRASQGGSTSAPQELNAGEMEALLSSLRDELGNPPPDLNVDALGTFIDLLSQTVGDGAIG